MTDHEQTLSRNNVSDFRSPWQWRPTLVQKCVVVGVIYALLSYFVFWPTSPFNDGRVVTCGCYDIAAQTWYMAWAPHALLSATNPFFTHALNVPDGVNLAANTAMPLLGILTEPITWLFGPFASFDVLLRLAFFLSALSMFFVLKRWVKSLTAAFIGGLLYGFSPYMFAQGSLHLNLAFVAVPPLILYVLDEIFVRRQWSVRREGLTLGILCAAQYLITAEILADIVLLTGIISVLLVVRFPRVALASTRHIIFSLAWALLPFVILCGYPILFALHGPQHVDVNSDLIYGDSSFRADLLSIIVPTSHQWFGTAHWKQLADAWVGANANENDVYLGVPIVIGLIACLVFVRDHFIRVLACVSALSFVFSLGPALLNDGKTTGIWLPFSLLIHVPILQIEVPARYALLTDLGAAMILAIGIDRLFRWSARRYQKNGRFTLRLSWHTVNAGFAILAAMVIAVGAGVTLWPRGAIASVKTNVPAYFTSPAVNEIPTGSTVLTYPYPIIRKNIAMSWQAEANYRFSIIGDYALTPFQTVAPNGGGPGGGLVPPTLNPPFIEEFFEQAVSGPQSLVPRPSAAAFSTTDTFIKRYGVKTILVDDVGKHPKDVITFFTRMFHAAPRTYGSLSVWYNVEDYHVPSVAPEARRVRHHKAT